MKRIGDKEMVVGVWDWMQSNSNRDPATIEQIDRFRLIAQAQLDSCEKQRKEMLAEIRMELEGVCTHKSKENREKRSCLFCWQSFWKKHLGE